HPGLGERQALLRRRQLVHLGRRQDLDRERRPRLGDLGGRRRPAGGERRVLRRLRDRHLRRADDDGLFVERVELHWLLVELEQRLLERVELQQLLVERRRRHL